MRLQLLRAGFFRSDAISYYIFARVCTVCSVPICVFLLIRLLLPNTAFLVQMVLVAASTGIAILLPDAFLARRQGQLEHEYRLVFPDMLDLLVVCVGAGLSIEGGFERVRGQLRKQSAALGLNLDMLAAEMRAGRPMVDALNSLADRLAIDEAASFVGVIRHSYELGGDVGGALRVFSDDMRDKRLLRAEEMANKLSVKIVLPLALFIFPVILTIIMLPVILKLLFVFNQH
ncbi:type II secretion system F family protein [Methylovirgula sp. 4M-Z18]|uniref:type II secretion system F family protein n=1 Tax=Methylovirgula sp. 4M-Z18 TaxID=2293567 RepID=UPI0018F6C957|nr:type II secretion system F family protein [Methylovirgula sp. 4M-Z18]